MMAFLDTIIEHKQREVAFLKQQFGTDYFQEQIEKVDYKSYSFLDALKKPGLSLIAELKKASPSKGVIREVFEPLELATAFCDHGASALSILTEKKYFLGHPSYVSSVKQATPLPILRKDFMIDPIQLYESKAIGADAVLLILACLSQDELDTLLEVADTLGLDVLVEAHTQEECERVMHHPKVNIIGINNRDLKTFEVDMGLAERLYPILKQERPDWVTVAESGYSSQNECDQLQQTGFNAVLIGEGMLRLAI